MAEEDEQPNRPVTNGVLTHADWLEVCQNVLIVLSIIFLSAMTITGFALLNSCPSQPLLAPYTILQGLGGLPLPILYAIRYRTTYMQHLDKKIFYTIIIVIIVISMVWLIVGTHWLNTSGCSGSPLHAANIAFVTILWLTAAISGIVFLLCIMVRFVNGSS